MKRKREEDEFVGLKKRVAIISRHAYPNYGSFFQAYALQCIIDEMGYDAFFINYQKKDEQSWRLAFSSLKESKMNKNLLKKAIYLSIQIPNYYIMNYRFKFFQKRYLKLTKLYSSYSKIQEDLPEAEIYMTGSDQVWNAIHNKVDYTYFLRFLDQEYYKVSYAASFGNDYIPAEEFENIRHSLLQYKNISVRETSGVSILNSLGISGECVLDPVLLMSQEKWKKLINNKHRGAKKYILIYQLHSNDKFDAYLNLVEKEYGLEIIRISTDYKQFKKSGRLLFLPEPLEVLSYFKNAELVITDSFHALIFSLIFERDFQVILPNKNSARLTDLLEMFDLKKVIISNFETIKYTPIDYAKVNKVIGILRNKSIDFLKRALEATR